MRLTMTTLDFTGYPLDFRVIPATTTGRPRSPLYGVGINDSDYQTQPTVDGKRMCCPAYQAWRAMLQRVYDPKALARRPTYKGVSVCEEWLTFSNFRRWLLQQHDWQNRTVEKDLIEPGNRVYSPATCMMAPHSVNTLFLCRGKKSNFSLPVGVCPSKGRYIAQLRIHGKNICLGYFATPDEAGAAYRNAKLTSVLHHAQQYLDEPQLYAAILDNIARVYAPEHYH